MPNFLEGLKNTEHTCRLGNDCNNCPIEFECTYSGFGWLLFSIGMSAKPIRVDFICRNCNDVIESTSDHEVLKKYVGR